MDKQHNSSSPSWYPDPPMEDECSSAQSYPDSSHKRLRTTKPAPLLTPGLKEIALEIEKLTEESCCLQREIDAMMQDLLRFKSCLEGEMMKRRRSIRTFGSIIQFGQKSVSLLKFSSDMFLKEKECFFLRRRKQFSSIVLTHSQCAKFKQFPTQFSDFESATTFFYSLVITRSTLKVLGAENLTKIFLGFQLNV